MEVHHPKAFDDVCKENNVSTVEQALECKDLWDTNNEVSICYRCHKNVESLRTKLRNIFFHSCPRISWYSAIFRQVFGERCKVTPVWFNERLNKKSTLIEVSINHSYSLRNFYCDSSIFMALP